MRARGLPGAGARRAHIQPGAEDRHREARAARPLLRLQRGAAPDPRQEQPGQRGAGRGPQGQQLPARDSKVTWNNIKCQENNL